MKQVIFGKAAVLLLALTASMMVLTGCFGNEQNKQAAASTASKAPVTYEVGAAEDYNGVASPSLEANYFQTPEEQAKYGAEMQDILENGIDVEKELQAGI